MIGSLAELFMHEGSKVETAAIVCDVRGGEFFDGLVKVLRGLDDSGVRHRLIFLEADEQVLRRRYQETRRRHPLAPSGTAEEGVAAARAAATARWRSPSTWPGTTERSATTSSTSRTETWTSPPAADRPARGRSFVR